MIIITRKLHRRRAAACLLLVLTLGVCGAGAGLSQNIRATSASAGTGVDPTGIRENEDRVAYLEAYGWIVTPEPAAMESVLIPETFDSSYDEYLSLQAEQGFDLTRYAGKTVLRCTYSIKNYPGLQENVWASLLIYKKTVIGGEVFCNQGGGFTRGLEYPVKLSD